MSWRIRQSPSTVCHFSGKTAGFYVAVLLLTNSFLIDGRDYAEGLSFPDTLVVSTKDSLVKMLTGKIARSVVFRSAGKQPVFTLVENFFRSERSGLCDLFGSHFVFQCFQGFFCFGLYLCRTIEEDISRDFAIRIV